MNRLLLAVLVLLPFCAIAQPPHAYIRLDFEDQQAIYPYGWYGISEDYDIDIAKPAGSLDTEQLDLSSIIEQATRPEDSMHVFVYIHGFAADTKTYQRFTGSRLHRNLYSHPNSPYNLIINIIWDNKNLYTQELPNMPAKGSALATLLTALRSQLPAAAQMDIMAHSMGNRILANACDRLTLDQPPFRHMILAAADLPADAFSKHPALANGTQLAQDITVYRHNNDRVLGFAQQFSAGGRLGLDGPTDYSQLPNNVRVVDASWIVDNEEMSSRLTNHRYFYTSPSGREDLLRTLGLHEVSERTTRVATEVNQYYILELNR